MHDHQKNAAATIAAGFGIAVTAALSLPLVNIFTELSIAELMLTRGLITALSMGIMFRKRIGAPSKYLIAFSVIFAAATLALYSGIRIWGASPTLVVITLTPVVNIGYKMIRGIRVTDRVLTSFVILLIGVTVALEPWRTAFNVAGLGVSLLGAVLAGISFEVLKKGGEIDKFHRTFWLGSVTAVAGFMMTVSVGTIPFAALERTAGHVALLVLFGLVGGTLYYLSNIVVVDKNRTEAAATIAMMETPAVVVASGGMLGEVTSGLQWSGIVLALMAGSALAFAEAKDEATRKKASSTPTP